VLHLSSATTKFSELLGRLRFSAALFQLILAFEPCMSPVSGLIGAAEMWIR
jgi:hypothetical protein